MAFASGGRSPLGGFKTKYDTAWDRTPPNLRWKGVPEDPFGPGVRYDMRSIDLWDRPKGEHGYDAISKCWLIPYRPLPSLAKPADPITPVTQPALKPVSVAMLKKQERQAEYEDKALF